jgi:RHS repeat-associated protein
VDSHAGTWTATYDADGVPTIDWPNGLRATTTVDETGTAASLSYVKTTGCSADCEWLAFAAEESIHGQRLAQTSTLSEQGFAYDAAGRLTQVEDTVNEACTTRRYAFDGGAAGNSNRTSFTTYGAAGDGSCQSASGPMTVTSNYDAADRITTTGTAYDALGRTTDVPARDVPSGHALTVGYYANDFVASLSESGGPSATYTADVNLQRVRSWASGGTTHTNHYGNDSDTPWWTQEGASAWTRNVVGLTGGLAATYDSVTSAATFHLTNMHGDVVMTVDSSTPLASFESTEFGAPRDGTARRYAWLGDAGREADTPGNVVLMGVRVYNPATGRFLQSDPVYGGSLNAYDYANADPIGSIDLDGRAVGDPGGSVDRCTCTSTTAKWATVSTTYGTAGPYQTIYAPPGALGEIIDWIGMAAGFSIDKVELKYRSRWRTQKRCTTTGYWAYRVVHNRQYLFRVTVHYAYFFHQTLTARKWSNEDWASKVRWV